VSEGHPYDERRELPAPVLPLLVATPGREESISRSALVDSGADCTLVPVGAARTLRLPVTGEVALSGLGRDVGRATTHAAVERIGAVGFLARVVAFADEAIVGRDLLNRTVVVLDGPRRGPTLTAAAGGAARARRRSQSPRGA
jgi:hypothetical protein